MKLRLNRYGWGVIFVTEKFLKIFQKNNEPKSKLPRLMGERARKQIEILAKH